MAGRQPRPLRQKLDRELPGQLLVDPVQHGFDRRGERRVPPRQLPGRQFAQQQYQLEHRPQRIAVEISVDQALRRRECRIVRLHQRFGGQVRLPLLRLERNDQTVMTLPPLRDAAPQIRLDQQRPARLQRDPVSAHQILHRHRRKDQHMACADDRPLMRIIVPVKQKARRQAEAAADLAPPEITFRLRQQLRFFDQALSHRNNRIG